MILEGLLLAPSLKRESEIFSRLESLKQIAGNW